MVREFGLYGDDAIDLNLNYCWPKECDIDLPFNRILIITEIDGIKIYYTDVKGDEGYLFPEMIKEKVIENTKTEDSKYLAVSFNNPNIIFFDNDKELLNFMNDEVEDIGEPYNNFESTDWEFYTASGRKLIDDNFQISTIVKGIFL